MKEFGSDFHYLPIQDSSVRTIADYYPDAAYYAVGRHALIDLYKKAGWNSLWVPEYFCHVVLASLEKAGIKLKFYQDTPLADERDRVLSLPYEKGDALLRVNYFGLRSRRYNDDIPVPVIEDHTHDLIGDWAINSDADWCIASLRKTLPLAEGGILWSPKGNKLQDGLALSPENAQLASIRWEAMKKKSLYLEDEIDDKNEFRPDMLSTEEQIDGISVSAIDDESLSYIKQFDIDRWYGLKRENREILKNVQFKHVAVLEPENSKCTPFSLTLLFDTATMRNDFRKYLIDHSVYPAILWDIPQSYSSDAIDFSKRMLSIHCDARYSKEEMIQLRHIVAGFRF